MNEQDQKACAYMNAAIARASIIAMGMQAENTRRVMENKPVSFGLSDFMEVIRVEGIGFNDTQSVLYHK